MVTWLQHSSDKCTRMFTIELLQMWPLTVSPITLHHRWYHKWVLSAPSLQSGLSIQDQWKGGLPGPGLEWWSLAVLSGKPATRSRNLTTLLKRQVLGGGGGRRLWRRKVYERNWLLDGVPLWASHPTKLPASSVTQQTLQSRTTQLSSARIPE